MMIMMKIIQMMQFVCGIGNCGSCVVIKTVAAFTDLDCFEDVAGSFEVHD
jgi:hypothetical protein